MFEEIQFPNAVVRPVFNFIAELVGDTRSYRNCPKHSDEEFAAICVRRVVSGCRSGRDFLQENLLSSFPDWRVGHFFDSINSERRCRMLRETLDLQLGTMPERAEWTEAVPELDRHRVFAGDGTYLAEACHGGTPGEPKTAVGQLFTLDLRTGALNHLALAEPAEGNSKEHEMRALKRTAVETLRQGAGKGEKVLHVWDRAGIDFRQWEAWKRRGIYVGRRWRCEPSATVRESPLWPAGPPIAPSRPARECSMHRFV